MRRRGGRGIILAPRPRLAHPAGDTQAALRIRLSRIRMRSMVGACVSSARTRWSSSTRRARSSCSTSRPRSSSATRRDELLGQEVTNIIPEGFAERLIADDLRSAEDALAQQIGTGIELTGLRKDGTRIPDRADAQPARQRRGHPGHGRDPRHQRPQRGRPRAPGPDGGPLSRPARGRAGRDGGGQPGRRDRPAQRPGREAVRLSAATSCSASRSRTSSRRASPSA